MVVIKVKMVSFCRLPLSHILHNLCMTCGPAGMGTKNIMI